MLKQAFLSGQQLPLLYLLALWSELILPTIVIWSEAAVVGAFNTIRQSSNQFNLVNVQQPNSGLR